MASLGPMAGLVEPESRARPLNRLLESETFGTRAKTGRRVIEAGPAVVHFGGFTVGETHTVKVKLLNVSTEIRGLHVIEPQTEFFKCFVKKRQGGKGGLYPGFADEVSIEFAPTEWRYYYDCLRVHVQDGDNLLIPIHAYPVPGKVDVPKRINFGHSAIGESVTRRIPLESNVPIAFQFSVLVTDPHPSFTISPTRGTVPAKGTTHIDVVYTPQSFSTSSFTFEFLLEQFNATPVQCECLGSCRPGLATDNLVKAAEESTEEAAAVATTASSSAESRKLRPHKRTGTKRLLTLSTTNQRGQSLPPKAVSSRDVAVAPPVEMNGVQLPKNMAGHAAVSYILNQPATSATGVALPLVEATKGERLTAAQRAERERRFGADLAKGKSRLHPSGERAATEETCRALAAERDRAATAYRDVLMLTPESLAPLTSATVTTKDSVLYRTVRRLDVDCATAAATPWVVDKEEGATAGTANDDNTTTTNDGNSADTDETGSINDAHADNAGAVTVKAPPPLVHEDGGAANTVDQHNDTAAASTTTTSISSNNNNDDPPPPLTTAAPVRDILPRLPPTIADRDRLFEPKPSDAMLHRARALARFVAAARKVVVQNRGWRRLVMIRRVWVRRDDGVLIPRAPSTTGGDNVWAENVEVLAALEVGAAQNHKGKHPLLSVEPHQVIGARFPLPPVPNMFGETRDRREVPEAAPPPTTVAAPAFWRLDVPWEFQLCEYTPYEPAPIVTARSEQEPVALPELSIVSRVWETEPTELPAMKMPTSVLGQDVMVGLPASCNMITATEHLPFAENSLERFFNPLRYFPIGTTMLDNMPGPQVLDVSARTSMTSAKVQSHPPVVDTPSLKALLPAEIPGLAEPFEDMLPSRPVEEDVEDEEGDAEGDEAESARAVTVFEASLQQLASELKVDLWGANHTEGSQESGSR
eukprot:m.184001 g.184001  ORF g.184001 m.184001 type:complete len:929 (+) comp16004_c0_seq1:53-2839(+)